MREPINQWFEQSTPFQGILACGVRHADHTAACKTWADGYTEAAIENALRCVSDIYQVAQLNRIPQGRFRLVYKEAVLHSERRADGTCLGVITSRDADAVDLDGLARYFSEFLAISESPNP